MVFRFCSPFAVVFLLFQVKLKTDLPPRCSVSAGDVEWAVIKYGAKTLAIGATGMNVKPFISCIGEMLFAYEISRYKAVRVRKTVSVHPWKKMTIINGELQLRSDKEQALKDFQDLVSTCPVYSAGNTDWKTRLTADKCSPSPMKLGRMEIVHR